MALIWVTFAADARRRIRPSGFCFLHSARGNVGAVTIKNPGILVFQSLPALVAIGLIYADRPYPKTEEEAIREIIKIERQLLALKSVDQAENPAEKDPAGMKPGPGRPPGATPQE